jgi:hypothetical protein
MIGVALIAAGCGGGGVSLPVGNGNSGGGGAGTVDVLTGPGPTIGAPVPSATRYAAMDKVKTKYDQLVAAGVAPLEREAQLATYMGTLPEFAKTGVAPDGTLWGQYADRSFYMFSDRAVPDDFVAKREGGRAPSLGFTSPMAPAPRPLAGNGLEVVNGGQAYVFETFDGSMGTPNEEITEMLEKRGYNVASGPATVEALRNVKNAGVFYISTHGGQASHPLNPGKRFWSMWTATEATPENDVKYQDDIRAGRLVVFQAEYGKSLGPFTYSERRYAITADWVKHYGWSFTDRSVAFINCCWSDQGGFTAALRSLARPASTTFGWDNAAHPEKAWRVARYFFDRGLGTNLAEPKMPGGMRPFTTDEVFAKEQQLGFTDGSTTIYGPCVLVKQGVNTMLAPSIMTMEVYERGIEPTQVKPQMILRGLLGKTLPKALTIGGTPATSVVAISETEWQVTLASAPGPGYAGQVQIETAAGIKSNAPLLTSWSGSFVYDGAPVTTEGNNVRGKITINGHFRADLHKYREVVDGPLVTPGARYTRASAGSTASWSITGAMPGWAYVTATSGQLPYGLRQTGSPHGDGYILDLRLDRGAGTVGFAFSYLSTNVDYTVPPAPGVYTIVIPRDNLLLSMPLQTPDRFGATLFTPKAVGNLLPDLTVASQVFNGMVPQMGTKLTVSSLSANHAPTANKEEDAS